MQCKVEQEKSNVESSGLKYIHGRVMYSLVV